MCTTKFFWTRLFIFAAAVAAALLLQRHPKLRAGAPPAGKKPVVVELFTSEGCSSCPPADDLLGKLRRESSANGPEVIPLGFHVDYWDFQGWRDRFDSAEFSKRQQEYAHQLRTDGPYTPQMVVNGELEFVGSNSSQAYESIAQASREAPAADVKIAGAGPDKIRVEVKSSQPAQVMLAVTEDNLATEVRAGENDGHTLHHTAVVRDLRSLGASRDGGFHMDVPLTLNKEWKRDDLRAVVFVQDSSGKILGAASQLLKSLSLK